MSEVEKSQLLYLYKRGIDYNRKYSILKNIISSFKADCSILELFGGVGITTYLIQKYVKPKFHKIIELDETCFELLKANFKDCTISKDDSFKLKEYWNEYDYIFYDYAVTPRKINDFFRFTEYNGTLIITETGIFKLIFDRNRNVLKHFNKLNTLFKEKGLYINEVFYTRKFSILLVSKNKSKMIIKECNNLTYDEEWKCYVDKYIFKMKSQIKLF